MREIKFSHDAFSAILAGKIRLTVRKHREWIHDLKVGEVFLGHFGENDGCVLLLAATGNSEQICFSELPRIIAKEAGYAGPKTLFKQLQKKHYPGLLPTDIAAVIRFRILKTPTGEFLWKPSK